MKTVSISEVSNKIETDLPVAYCPLPVCLITPFKRNPAAQPIIALGIIEEKRWNIISLQDAPIHFLIDLIVKSSAQVKAESTFVNLACADGLLNFCLIIDHSNQSMREELEFGIFSKNSWDVRHACCYREQIIGSFQVGFVFRVCIIAKIEGKSQCFAGPVRIFQRAAICAKIVVLVAKMEVAWCYKDFIRMECSGMRHRLR